MSDPRDACVLAVGDELLAGKHADLDMPLIANRLAEHGRRVVEARVVQDELATVAAAVRELAGRAPLVFVTGGLGPTPDDLTRHAVAAAAGVDVVHSDEAWEQVRAWYARSNRPMPDANRRQALVPEGAAVVANPAGTAPGFRVTVDGATVVALPGPPREVAATWTASVAPWLDARPIDGRRAVGFLHLEGVSESVFAEEAARWLDRAANPQAGVTVSDGVLSLRLVAEDADPGAARERLARTLAEVRAHFGDAVISDRHADPARALGEELLARRLSVTAAESCTGGMVAAALTEVPAISAVLGRTFVTYANEAKTEELGVDPALLASEGAVSEAVVRAMAAGAAARAGADLAIATSGVAGPDGGTDEKPVGLVWFAVAVGGEVHAHERRWPPNAERSRIRRWATQHALATALRHVRTLP